MKNSMVESPKKRPFHQEYDDIVGSFSFSCSSSSEISSGSSSSLGSDSSEEVTSPASPSSSSSSSYDPLSDMSSLFQQLPIKRGLSKFYQGKSQSFTSLAKVASLEDLQKPENPANKRLKSCKSFGGVLSPSAMSRNVSKRGMHSASSRTRSSCFSSMNARRSSGNFMGTRPPIPAPHRSTSTTVFPNQTVLFA